jgi:hypothetical protein
VVVLTSSRENLTRFRHIGRGLQYGLLLAAWVFSQQALAQLDDAFSVAPPIPFSSAPFTIQIHALWGYSPSPGLVPSRTTVSGTTIRIDGCLPTAGFSVGSDYWVDAVVGPLPPGTYSIEYYTSHYCSPNATDPPRLDLVDQVVVAAGPPLSPISAVNYEGLWWNAPAGSESGWGISFAHQGNVIVATWFTYDLTGKGWWLVMTAPNTGGNTFSGTLYQTTGPPFDAELFDPSQVTRTPVGVGTIAFTDANNGTFAYTVNGISQSKNVTRQVFGALPECIFDPLNNLVTATNFQDLWWNSPGGSESGWGISLTHQSDTIFGVWFTYDYDRSPMWLVTTAKQTSGYFLGDLLRTTGPAFNAVPFDPAAVQRTKIGDVFLGFIDGNRGVFTYTVDGSRMTKLITREVFRSPGTLCR